MTIKIWHLSVRIDACMTSFCIKFPNHHFCICVMEIMWGIPFIFEPNQGLTCIMSSDSTSFEPKSWLTINLDPRWECQSLSSEAKKEGEGKFPIKEKAKKRGKEIPNQRVGESEKKRKKIPNQRMGESNKRKKAPDQGSKENRRNVQKGLWTGQYLNNTELSPNEQKGRKGNHDLKWYPPLITNQNSVR